MELKTPLRIVNAKYNDSFWIEDADGNTVADDGFSGSTSRMNADIARRFVACANACDGFPTEELEEKTFEDVIIAMSNEHVSEINELLECSSALLNSLKLRTTLTDHERRMISNLYTAIAKASAQYLEIPGEFPWIMWHGGERPVPIGTDVEIRLRNGTVRKMKSEDCCWNHPNPLMQSFEIAAYRVVDPAYRVAE